MCIYFVYPNLKCSPSSSPFFVDELGKSVTTLQLFIVPVLVIVDLQPVFNI